MSDPLTTFDITVVSLVVVALASVVTALWLAFKAQVTKVEKAQEDLVKRVRDLETARLEEVKEYARRSDTTNARVLAVFGRAVDIMQEMAAAMSEWNKRPCVSEAKDISGKRLAPVSVPQVDTDILLKHDEKAKKRQQEESSQP